MPRPIQSRNLAFYTSYIEMDGHARAACDYRKLICIRLPKDDCLIMKGVGYSYL